MYATSEAHAEYSAFKKRVRLCSRFDLRGRYSRQKKPTPANTDKSAVLYLYNSAINEPPPYSN